MTAQHKFTAWTDYKPEPKLEPDQPETKTPAEVIEAAIAKLDTDAGAVLEPDVIEAFRALSLADLARYRDKVKATKRVSLRAFDKAVNGSQQEATTDESIAAQIVNFVLDRAELFTDADKEPYARINTGNHSETWAIGSEGYKEWIAAELYREAGILPKTDPIKDASLALSGIAKFGRDGNEPEQREVFIRAGKTDKGYAVDLCNDEWQAVIVEPGRWYLDNAQSVAFRRNRNMRPLPTPLTAGAGNLDPLWKLTNVKDDDKNMLLAWMLESWRTDTACPVCEIGNTEQGSGKSRMQSTIRNAIDPNAVNLRGRPKTAEDVYVAAKHSLIVSYENLSHLTDDMQDTFCILATGGGFASRTLFTNFEEAAMSAKRPIIMNGIGTLATRQDLVDRLINIELDPITPDKRKTDAELDEIFEQHKAEIFTGLLDLFAKALEILPSIRIDSLPRMADFALFGAAVYAARGVADPAATFMADYNQMREDAIHRSLDSSPIAAAIIAYLDKHPEGTEFNKAKAAMDALAEYKTDGESWPRSPKGFAESIKRLAPAFRQIGIRAENGKTRSKHGYSVTIKPTKPTACEVVKPDFKPKSKVVGVL